MDNQEATANVTPVTSEVVEKVEPEVETKVVVQQEKVKQEITEPVPTLEIVRTPVLELGRSRPETNEPVVHPPVDEIEHVIKGATVVEVKHSVKPGFKVTLVVRKGKTLFEVDL